MIVDSALYRDGVRVPLECSTSDLPAVRAELRERGGFVWVGLHEPSSQELDEVADVFDLHPLAVEDAVHAHQRPKLERYEGSLFLVLKTLWYVDAEDAVETGEINLFMGSDFVVTVRHGQGSELHSARRRLEAESSVLAHGPSAVVYAVCDTVVDAYSRVAAELEVDVDEVEESVFSPARTEDSARIYTLKREIAEVRRAVLPLREPMRQAANGTVVGMDAETAPFFRDVHDHLAKVAETIDTLDGLLSTAFEAYLARIQVHQNEDIRKISAVAALVLLPTLIAGIYGMNFQLWPSPNWAGSFWFAIALMGTTAVGLWWYFKRSGWL